MAGELKVASDLCVFWNSRVSPKHMRHLCIPKMRCVVLWHPPVRETRLCSTPFLNCRLFQALWYFKVYNQWNTPLDAVVSYTLCIKTKTMKKEKPRSHLPFPFVAWMNGKLSCIFMRLQLTSSSHCWSALDLVRQTIKQ